MDVNGTRHHLLLGEDDWSSLIPPAPPGEQPDLAWDEAFQSLSLRPLLFRFPAAASDKPLEPTVRRGAGRDRYGNWYWIDGDGTGIRVLWHEDSTAGPFWSSTDLWKACADKQESGDFAPLEAPIPQTPWKLRGLAVTTHHYLVVGVLEPKGVIVFDLHGGGPPRHVPWPEQVPFAPLDIAPAADGGVWILDQEPRYWALDRYFRVIDLEQGEAELEPYREHDFQPVEPEAGEMPRAQARATFPTGIDLTLAAPIDAENPISIEGLPDGSVIILDNAPSTVYRYRLSTRLGEPIRLDGLLDDVLEPDANGLITFLLRGHDLAFVAEATDDATLVRGSLFVASADGNQTFGFRLEGDDLEFSLAALRQYYPMRLYSGKALVSSGGQAWYDLQERWIPLAEQPRPRYELEGVLETRIFDGREPACVWHRLALDACIPAGTEVMVESRTADLDDLVPMMPWQKEPRLYKRGNGSEIPWQRPFSPEEQKREGTGTWELLFQRAVGRYLQVRLTLRGTGRSSPRLKALRAYYPRFSYLRSYLPAVYREDETSASFLDRFLSNVEGFYTAIEGRIERVQRLFDVRSVPSDYLEWLAGWFGVMLDPAWDESRRRLFLRHAMELFAQRGTPAGIVRAIRLAIDPCPDDSLFEEDVLEQCYGGDKPCPKGSKGARYAVRIVEKFLTRDQPGVLYGDPTDLGSPGVNTGGEWTPDQGAGALHERYREFLATRYPSGAEEGGIDLEALNAAWGSGYESEDEVLLSPVLPSLTGARTDWREFIDGGIGFTYAEPASSDLSTWQAFLGRRYRQASRLNQAYQWTGSKAVNSFSKVTFPAEDDFPASGARLYDWIQFVSLVLPIRRSAHRFTVLIPVELGETQADQARRRELVSRIVGLEKPAHTNYEVKQYWALFRVGEARLGLDTRLDVGSRFAAILLGSSHLGEGYLAGGHPWNVPDRIVTGRDRAGSGLVL